MRSIACFSLFGAFALRAAAQGAIASNTTASNNSTQDVRLAINMPGQDGGWLYTIIPLTQGAYNRLPHGPQDQTYVNASLVPNTPGSGQVTSLHPYDVAYISCDAVDYPGEISMQQVITTAIDANIKGILFYSQVKNYCNLTDLPEYNGYDFMYSMIEAQNSHWLLGNITGNGPYVINMAHLYSGIAYFNHMQAGSAWDSLNGSGSTAVAMIILYSITGVITALFLVIIVTGAVRAHRHPERYGPRNVLGRARQSRAKGIARAMLETIPIVKFGENRDDAAKDMELQPGASSELTTRGVDGTSGSTNPEVAEAGIAAGGITMASQTAGSPDPSNTTNNAVASSSSPGTSHAAADEDTQGCSICTDDFERGQDIRVLPCGHQFHPACVDPWLLDVSGTCPLCRVDLNPQASNGARGDDELPPPLDPEAAAADEAGIAGPNRKRDTIRSFFVRGWGGTSGLVTANQQQRMEALRRWREENRANATASSPATAATPGSSTQTVGAETVTEEDEDSRRRNRLGGLSRLMRRR